MKLLLYIVFSSGNPNIRISVQKPPHLQNPMHKKTPPACFGGEISG
ncbi:MAG: hypothetical protein DSM106950_34885 [Stigonema ocellatum SAG 48.90 = DSM 106950]|nr:hypothetical protein [Stigonema ocellatum SAG 48.90 = DSM 106950]